MSKIQGLIHRQKELKEAIKEAQDELKSIDDDATRPLNLGDHKLLFAFNETNVSITYGHIGSCVPFEEIRDLARWMLRMAGETDCKQPDIPGKCNCRACVDTFIKESEDKDDDDDPCICGCGGIY